MASDQNKLSAMMERGRLSKRLAVIGLVLSAASALTVFLAGPVYQWSGMELFTLGLLPFTLAALFSLISLIQSVFFIRTAVEEEEKLLLEKRKSTVNSLLDISEDVRFTAQRSYETFLKYIPSAAALLCFFLCAGGLAAFWTNSLMGAADTAVIGSGIPKNPINLAFLCAMLAVFTFVGGIFFVGQSHVREFRALRPAGSMLILGSAVMLLSAFCALLLQFGKTGYDVFVEKIVLLIFALLTIEFLVSFVMEFYRPRTKEEWRPVYESRILALFTEPGGVMRNIANSLDYQFGFQVSKTWIYGFFQRHLIPALIVWGVFLWLFTCIAEIAPGEYGIRQRFGACPADGKTVLPAGIHLKLPWPCEQIIRVPVNIVQTITIGAKIDKEKAEESGKVILWTGQHYLKEDMFLVATRQTGENAVPTKIVKNIDDVPPAASLLEVSLPLYYKAKEDQPYNYAFQFKDIPDALLAVGQAEATSYFASTDFMSDLSSGREEVSRQLRDRIQKTCDSLHMGVDILSIGMHDAHPPVGKVKEDGSQEDSPGAMPNVAESFQEVVCAREDAETACYKAEASQYETVYGAMAEASRIISDAEAYKFNVSHVASTDASRFQSQMASFIKQPEMFQLRAYLDFLENDCAEIRKYVVSSGIKTQNYLLNLEAKPSLDLLDTDLSLLGK